MRANRSLAITLSERLCRPQRVGVFGHRGVGKTTLLTMLYREAVGGRLPGLRLAAADARTADYLSDKVLQLEAGEPLPATLGETELRFHLYHEGKCHDLLVMDYQGEHVAVGRHEPIRDFLRECDAVWLCLDVPVADAPDTRLRAEQEVEQLVEDYLSAETSAGLHRPTALVLTKADLLPDSEHFTNPGNDPAPLDKLVTQRFGMTRHALHSHHPQRAVFAVSSLGGPVTTGSEGGGEPFRPRPVGLEGPLTWLSGALEIQDEARLEQMWGLAGGDLALLERCVAAFARRYPDAPATADCRQRLRQLRRRRVRRRLLAGAVAAGALVLGVLTYDLVGKWRLDSFEAGNADLEAVRAGWQSYRAWHPTRNLLRPAQARAEGEHLHDLDARIREERRVERLAQLRRQADDPDADPREVRQGLLNFREDFPEQDVDAEWQAFRARVKERYDRDRERRARADFADLERAEQRGNLEALVEQADRFLRNYGGTTYEDTVRRRRVTYLTRLDERGIEGARSYSASNPLNFHTRAERYRSYLECHTGGAFVKEANDALRAIDLDWDKYDFRAVRDHYRAHPADVKELGALCRSYLAAHPHGRFKASANDLLRWGERVTAVGEYRVVLRSGQFENKAAAFFSRGPSLSVEIEVNGVRYGPSNIVKRRYDPDWDYEFPRRVRWKLGDGVRIFVTDNYYWKRSVLTISSEDDDRLAMRLLSGEVASGPNSLVFESDFAMPVLPRIE